MDNSNRDNADNWPTQQLWPTPGAGGNGGHGPTPPGSNPGANPPGPSGRGPWRTGRVTRVGIGIAAAAVLVGGGAVAVAASGHAASPSSQASTLNTVLSAADSPSSADLAAASPTATATTPAAGKRAARCAKATARLKAAGHPKAAQRAATFCRRRLGRLRLLVHGIHGQFTFQTKKGPKTLAFERGTVQSVSGSDVTIAASDGTTWTWHLVSNSVVRQGGKKVASATLASGQLVFAGGPVLSGSDDARLIVIRPAAAAGSGSSSAAPSASASAPAGS